MKLLVTGRGTSGSWKIRGEQLGRAVALGRELAVHIEPNALDVGGYDAAVVVKRAPSDLLARLHRMNVPIVWDVVDAWPQPIGNTWGLSQALDWLRGALGAVKPAAIVAATDAMRMDLQQLTDVPVLTLPHHARPYQSTNPIRHVVQMVGYEGGAEYIRRWEQFVFKECAARGWRFVKNPEQLAHVDIMLALRDQGGYPPRRWKSNVKLANAQGTGTPAVCCREHGYLETASGAEEWADTPAELAAAFDQLAPFAIRKLRMERMRAVAPTLESVAEQYKAWLCKLSF